MWQRLVCLTILLILAAVVIPAQITGHRLTQDELSNPTKPAQETKQHRLNQDEVYSLIKQDKHQHDLIEKTLHEQGVDFDLNADIEKKMRKAGADDQILQAIWAAGPTVRNFEGAVLTSATGTPLTSTYKEAMGYKTLEQASDPDTKIRMAMEFAQTFPGSKLLSYVFTQAATAFQQKGDYSNAVKTGRKSLAIDADNTYSLLIVATSLSEPSMIRNSTDNGEWELVEAGTDAQRALDLLPKLPTRPDETPEQFAARKAGIESTAHAALGAVAMQQDKYNQAIDEFKKAISLSRPPKASLYFRLGEIYSNVGAKQQAIEAFSKAAELGKGTAIETYATRSLKELQQN